MLCTRVPPCAEEDGPKFSIYAALRGKGTDPRCLLRNVSSRMQALTSLHIPLDRCVRAAEVRSGAEGRSVAT